jgi:hypothetical protein
VLKPEYAAKHLDSASKSGTPEWLHEFSGKTTKRKSQKSRLLEKENANGGDVHIYDEHNPRDRMFVYTSSFDPHVGYSSFRLRYYFF